MIGFVNALAILIFMAQFPQFAGATWVMYAMVAASLAIIYIFPRLTTAVPSPLVAIAVMSVITIVFHIPIRTVGDMGQLPSAFPKFGLPAVPLNWETLRIILPYAIPLSFVGLIESLLTATLIDDLTDTRSDKNQECVGQGISNIVAGLFGGMAGCAMIGQSMINIKSNGRGRLSTLCAGVFLLGFIVLGHNWVKLIPMGALVAVMFMVSIATFDWASFKSLRLTPRSETLVMVATVVTVVQTHDLAEGVAVGIVLSAIFFARRLAKLVSVTNVVSPDGETHTYVVHGQLFFVSTEAFLKAFDWKEPIKRIVVDLTHSHLWDSSAVGAIDKVVLKARRLGIAAEIVGMNHASETILESLAVHHKIGNAEA
jgi:SulP family sulfate permease